MKAGDYAVQMARGTFENWQSEFLQLIWQVGGLAFLWHVGSPQSKEGDDRKEEKIDAILKALAPQDAERILKEIEVNIQKRTACSKHQLKKSQAKDI